MKKHIHLSKSYIKNNKAYKAFNNVFMFLKDIIHLPRDIRKKFIQADKLEKEVIKKCDTGGGGNPTHSNMETSIQDLEWLKQNKEEKIENKKRYIRKK